MDTRIYNNLDMVLKRLRIHDDSYTVKYSNIEKLPGKFADIIIAVYDVTIKDETKPSVIYDVYEGITRKIRKYGQSIIGKKFNVDIFFPKLNIIKNGEIVHVLKHNDNCSSYEINLGTDNEKILESFSGQGMMEDVDARVEYYIESYQKDVNYYDKTGAWSFVEDSKLYLNPIINISNISLVYTKPGVNVDDFPINEKNLYVEQYMEMTNEHDIYEFMLDERTRLLIDTVIDRQTPISVKTPSKHSLDCLEWLFYSCGEDWVEIPTALPGLSDVVDSMSNLLENVDDSYVNIRATMNTKTNHKIGGSGSIDYSSDSFYDSLNSFSYTYLMDYIVENQHILKDI